MKEWKAELIAELKEQMKAAMDKDDFNRIEKLSSYIVMLKGTDSGTVKNPDNQATTKKAENKKHPRQRILHPVGTKLTVKYLKKPYVIEVVPEGYAYNEKKYPFIGKLVDDIAGAGKAGHLRQISAWKVVD